MFAKIWGRLRRVKLRYWAWMHAFAALGLGWGHAIALQPPASYTGVVDLSSIFRLGVVTAIGGVIAIVGMFLTTSLHRKTISWGLWIELFGTVLLGGGPFQYLTLQLGFLVAGQFDQRYALAWFSYSMFAFILVRFSILIPALIVDRREAFDQDRREAAAAAQHSEDTES